MNARNLFKQKMNDCKKEEGPSLRRTVSKKDRHKNEKTLFSTELVDNTITNLKKGKAVSLDKLTANIFNMHNAHPCVVLIITKILNLMLICEFVPDSFGQTLTVPIPK